MKTKVLLSGLFLFVVLLISACTQLRTPSAPPGMETATAIAEASQTAVALQTAGIEAQQTATALAIIVLSYTPTMTPTSEPTATPTTCHGFRPKTMISYTDNVIQMSLTYSDYRCEIPVSGSSDIYDNGVLAGSSQFTFDINGNTVSAQATDLSGNTTGMMTIGTVVNGLVIQQDSYQNGVLMGYSTMQYNPSGLMTRRDTYLISPSQHAWETWAYNAQGFVTVYEQYTDSGLTSREVNTYDAQARLTRKDLYGPTGALQAYSINSYNAFGNIQSTSTYDAAGVQYGTANFVYDSNQNQTEIHTVSSFLGYDSTSDIYMTYDANNNLTSVEINSTDFFGVPTVQKYLFTWESY